VTRREFTTLLAMPALAPAQTTTDRPRWLKEGIVMVGSWEAPIFLTRRGGELIDVAQNWKEERTEASVRALKEAGVNLVITNLHKGFGLQTEAGEIEATRLYTRLAHEFGIRVGGYVGGTLMYETLFEEEPGAREWVQRDEYGHPSYYFGDQTFRYVACHNNPDYHAFLEKVLRLGIEDLKLDLIHFDYFAWPAEPRSCHCQYCRQGFQRFLNSRYANPTRALKRFGFSRIKGIVPPPYNDVQAGPLPFRDVHNPVMQEWAMFRAASLATRFAEFEQFIHRLNPEVALEGNPNLNFARNLGFTQGVDVAQLLEHGDIVWSEGHNDARFTEGRIVSRVRAFKSVRVMGKSLFVYTGGRYAAKPPASPPELLLAEAMAFNGANLGMVGDLSRDGVNLTPAAHRYVRFFLQRAKDLTETDSAAEVAVLRSFPAIEFNPAACNVSTILFEQTLLQSQTPFDIVFNRHLAKLGRYKVLVLANQDALSDAELVAIQRFVADGGGLVATGETSLRNEWRQRRERYGLRDLFGFDLPPGRAVRRVSGKGRVAFLPAIEPSIAPPVAQGAYDFDNKYWAAPRNASELVEAVRWASGGLSIEVQAPVSVATELVHLRRKTQMLLHLINFDVSNTASPLSVRFRAPSGSSIGEIGWESPDEDGTVTPLVKNGPAEANITISKLRIYGLLRVQLVKL
jgi:hypothetical protein